GQTFRTPRSCSPGPTRSATVGEFAEDRGTPIAGIAASNDPWTSASTDRRLRLARREPGLHSRPRTRPTRFGRLSGPVGAVALLQSAFGTPARARARRGTAGISPKGAESRPPSPVAAGAHSHRALPR